MNPNKIAELLPIYEMELYPPDSRMVDLNTADDMASPIPVLILLQPEDQNETSLGLLQKMMSACQLTPLQFAIHPIHSNEMMHLIQKFQPEAVLIFGVLSYSDAFHFDKPLNKPFRFGGRKFLITNTLKEIEGNQQLKAALWTNGLKPIFQIS